MRRKAYLESLICTDVCRNKGTPVELCSDTHNKCTHRENEKPGKMKVFYSFHSGKNEKTAPITNDLWERARAIYDDYENICKIVYR